MPNTQNYGENAELLNVKCRNLCERKRLTWNKIFETKFCDISYWSHCLFGRTVDINKYFSGFLITLFEVT